MIDKINKMPEYSKQVRLFCFCLENRLQKRKYARLGIAHGQSRYVGLAVKDHSNLFYIQNYGKQNDDMSIVRICDCCLAVISFFSSKVYYCSLYITDDDNIATFPDSSGHCEVHGDNFGQPVAKQNHLESNQNRFQLQGSTSQAIVHTPPLPPEQAGVTSSQFITPINNYQATY